MKDNKERQLIHENLNRETTKYFFIGFIVGIVPFIVSSILFYDIRHITLLIGVIASFINAYYMHYLYRQKCKILLKVKKGN